MHLYIEDGHAARLAALYGRMVVLHGGEAEEEAPFESDGIADELAETFGEMLVAAGAHAPAGQPPLADLAGAARAAAGRAAAAGSPQAWRPPRP